MEIWPDIECFVERRGTGVSFAVCSAAEVEERLEQESSAGFCIVKGGVHCAAHPSVPAPAAGAPRRFASPWQVPNGHAVPRHNHSPLTASNGGSAAGLQQPNAPFAPASDNARQQQQQQQVSPPFASASTSPQQQPNAASARASNDAQQQQQQQQNNSYFASTSNSPQQQQCPQYASAAHPVEPGPQDASQQIPHGTPTTPSPASQQQANPAPLHAQHPPADSAPSASCNGTDRSTAHPPGSSFAGGVPTTTRPADSQPLSHAQRPAAPRQPAGAHPKAPAPPPSGDDLFFPQPAEAPAAEGPRPAPPAAEEAGGEGDAAGPHHPKGGMTASGISAFLEQLKQAPVWIDDETGQPADVSVENRKWWHKADGTPRRPAARPGPPGQSDTETGLLFGSALEFIPAAGTRGFRTKLLGLKALEDLVALPLDTATVTWHGDEIVEAAISPGPIRQRIHPCRLKAVAALSYTIDPDLPPQVTKAAVERAIAARYGAAALSDKGSGPSPVSNAHHRISIASPMLVDTILKNSPLPVPFTDALDGAERTVWVPLMASVEQNYYTAVPVDPDVPFVNIRAASIDTSAAGWWGKTYFVQLEEIRSRRWWGRVVASRLCTSGEALTAAAHLPQVFPAAAGAAQPAKGRRVDLTRVFTCSVDKRGTQLYDDAFSAEALPPTGAAARRFTVLVHIADPSAFVPAGSDIDAFLRRKTGDVYLPHENRVERLAPDDILRQTSLDAGAPRQAVSLLLLVEDGKVTYDAVFRSTIVSSCCLDMTDEMDWSQFRRETCVLAHDASLGASGNARALALDRCEALAGAVADMKRERGFLQEATQGRAGPASLIQYLMILCKQRMAAHLFAVTYDRHFTVCRPPSPEDVEKVHEVCRSAFIPFDASSETAACLSLASLRGQPYYYALAKYLNFALRGSAEHNSGYEQQTGTGGHADAESVFSKAWPVSTEAPCTSPLRKYQDLVAIRAISTGLRDPMSVLDVFELDALAAGRRRVGNKLKKTYFVEKLFGVSPHAQVARTVVPRKCRIWVLDVSPQRGKVRLYNEVLDEAWETDSKDMAPRYQLVQQDGGLFAAPASGSDVATVRLEPLQTTFWSVLELDVSFGFSLYKYRNRILSPAEAQQYDAFPPQLTTDTPDPYLELCPLPPPPVQPAASGSIN
ncbi:hypothetical protein DIPPA_31812 [Diplonema papillatum]|nr:hypothetical protein DIPPA_31812 [Diplonema papillatum]